MLQRLSVILSGISKAIAALAVALLAILISYVVFSRFVTHTTPHWAEELPRLVLVWSAFIGGVTCSFERSHLMAGLLPFVVRSPRVLNFFERLNQVFVIVGLIVLGYAGWELADLTMDQTLPALDVSAGAVYLALPFACAITVVVHLAQLFEPAPAKE
ncbi:TRAP transporter small permease [Bordetella hinzii]|jgi:TRAP-type C4-dicarboxylate transport system permease small subunit|uniref:TRAP transporter small permease protein n=2 Tax=Bordetella hinzii TaxID=103855 RepID=A0AAN1RZD7_9BORD|nr:TRAP transporter small permease [Bordetella hinzii]AKQ55614.1 2,3-diketo-L-gulonate TRAP transporter small permease protein YiaM [Bordetella hinzii]AKQ60116.1 2,3-diketo-L-gulonate TRAP transporter small permease protein YiaM [Bordetella hinzii]AZW18798.1 TRAP transporter small permease [Bordetella hinzii]KCB24475.1 TRAP transporter, DctQ-like membrane protein [Bordetella hinzii OH87 BAL007II]KCB26699.1 TRAP transporter, DctQ-like membrane protein [Bordetella hinzii CA90 BAL1384]